jgi:iron complex transport system ATP-binding protein
VRVPNLEVRNFVAIGRFPYTGWTNGLSESDWKVVDASLQLVGVQHLASRDITAISDGERQRAMIAFALAQDTKIILLDEPTAFLDLPNKFEMVRLLSHLAATQNKTIIYSTHDLQGAINEADNIWMMLTSGLISGAPEDLALSKGFEELLANTNVQFDAELGSFRNKKTGSRKISVNGEGLQLTWTIKMLQRIGYQVADNENEGLSLSCSMEKGVPMWSVEGNGTLLFQSQNLKDLAKRLRRI